MLAWKIRSVAYYNGNMCFYEGQRHPDRLHVCSFSRFFRTRELNAGQR